VNAAAPAWVHTPDGAVPPLDRDTELAGRIEDLEGIHPGVDLWLAGARLIATDRLTRDETQTLLAVLGGSADNTDLLGLVGALVRHLSDAEFNPALRTLDADTAANVRRRGAAVAVDLDTTAPRDLVAENCAAIDPYTTSA
jgi:hypothetical protein